jgi:hypothetical protein
VTPDPRAAESSLVLDPASAFVNRLPLRAATLTSHQEVFQHEGNVPDHTWHEFDSRGHFHGWSESGVLPTLRTEWHLRDCTERCSGECADGMPDDGFPAEARHLCKLCGDRIMPRMMRGFSLDRGRQWYTARVTGGGDLVELGGMQVTFVHPGGFGTGTLEVRDIAYDGGSCTASAIVHLVKWWPRRVSGGAL